MLLAGAFWLGAGAGCVCAGRLSGSVGEDISAYLTDYLILTQQGRQPVSGVWALAAAYVQMPLLAFFSAFTTVGFLLLPAAAAGLGFSLAYAAGCLRWAFGAKGLFMAGGLFGLRCLVAIPCFFLLAVPAWDTSGALLRLSLGAGPPPVYGRRWWLRSALVCGVLWLGICADIWISPLLWGALAPL